MLMEWLTWVLLTAKPAGVALIYEPGAETHREVAAAVAGRDRSVISLAVGEPWPAGAPPQRVLALGDRAASDAARRWPERPLAAALVYTPPATASLSISASPETECTARTLAARGGPWLILASPDDAGAGQLAAALGGELVRGTPRLLHGAVQDSTRAHIWLRARPEVHTHPWLRFLGLLARTPAYVGTDAPGLRSFGLHTPVEIDPDAVAERLHAWTRKRTPSDERASRPAAAAVEEAPCRQQPNTAPPSDRPSRG